MQIESILAPAITAFGVVSAAIVSAIVAIRIANKQSQKVTVEARAEIDQMLAERMREMRADQLALRARLAEHEHGWRECERKHVQFTLEIARLRAGLK